MQALWYTHQSASTGRHKHHGRYHREARRSARIGMQSRNSSHSARAPSACKKTRRLPMIESTRAACGASAVDRCEIITAHGPGEASDLLRGGLGGPGLARAHRPPGRDHLEPPCRARRLRCGSRHGFWHALGALAERDENALALLIRAQLRACLWHLLRS